MRVVVLHNAMSQEASEADRDVLAQVEAVGQALRQLGHEPIRVYGTLDLSTVRLHLMRLCPGVVFNLVESLDGSDWLMYLATALLDTMGLPYTGAPTEAIFLSTHKLLAKERLCQAGLPTPRWLAADSQPVTLSGPERCERLVPPEASWIVKTVKEHASLGLDDESVLSGGDDEYLRNQLRTHAARLGCPCFVEEYVEGREFNLSLLAGPDGPEVLPPAEIDFSAFPTGKPRIVGYRAKWEQQSFEYRHTPRCFDFPASQQSLLDQLHTLAIACWHIFGLRGYARVDFRVDAQQQPWILEVNANPCLSPDAGFAAALDRASIGFDQAVQRILNQAVFSVRVPQETGR